MLVGVHEVRNFWHSVVECHAIYNPGFVVSTHSRAIGFFASGCWLIPPSPTA
ncbi:Uncharacterised protein [Klebsiella pneumoniae]|uniref:Uncharacterized protein n=1 Tax=Klebsiella pneumoniae TaxID=573 RepID=A0A377XMT8_KLEPN|nr:Uncharacterised protein [Klebsiella pneumoniae]